MQKAIIKGGENSGFCLGVIGAGRNHEERPVIDV